MKYSLGLTAVTILALTGLYVSGCSAPSSHGMGILDPYETPSEDPFEPGPSNPTPDPTSTVDPGVGDKLLQDSLTNPTGILKLSGFVNSNDGYLNFASYWSLQYDKSATSNTTLMRIAGDTLENKSDLDRKSPCAITLWDVANNKELILKDAISIVKVENVTIADHKANSDKVFSEKYNPTSDYLIIADNCKDSSSGRIIIVNPHEESGGTYGKLYAKVLYESAKKPVKIAADNKYIWWVECRQDAQVQRMEYASNPDTINDKDYRVRPFVSGMTFPSNIISNGAQVFVADTGGNRILAAPTVLEGEKETASGLVISKYETNYSKNVYVLEGGSSNGAFKQPYALCLLDSGKLLFADGGGDPLVGIINPLNDNNAGIYIWDIKSALERGEGSENLGTRVVKLKANLNNPLSIGLTYDASRCLQGAYAQYVDVVVPEYNIAQNNSNLSIFRFATAFNNSKLIKSKVFYNKADRTTEVFPVECVYSTTELPENLPENDKKNINFLYNEGIGETTNNLSSIRIYQDDYPL